MLQKKFDIIILGGGVCGLLLAKELSNSNFNILVIEKQNLSKLSISNTQARAINLSSYNILQKHNLIYDIDYAKIQKIYLYQNKKQIVNFAANEIKETTLAYIIDQISLQKKLFLSLRHYSNIKIIYTQMNSLVYYNQKHHLICKNGNQYECNLLVGADGKNSWLSRQANINDKVKDYQQLALCANVQMLNNHDNIAKQYFLKTGPIGLLPLVNNKEMALIWSTDNLQAKKLLQLNNEDFISELKKITDLDIIAINSKRVHFALYKKHASNYMQNKIVLLGDAAHVIHPLAGLGLNLAILDSVALANNLKKYHLSNKALLKYIQTRRFYNTKIMIFSDLIKKISGNVLLSLAAKIFIFNNIKCYFIKQATY